MNKPDQRPLAGLPLLSHPYDKPSVFSPKDLVEAVKSDRNIQELNIPDICILEFDGDLTDKLNQRGELIRCDSWPCFHTDLWCWQRDGISCGIIPRTIGGPYTVLIAEQLAVCGVKAVVGLTSAGRISQSLPLPGIVVADEAIRDEGVSYHYLPPADTVEATPSLIPFLKLSLENLEQPVQSGLVWTTDAPYRETKEEIDRYADRGALAVEMQAASLFSFGVYMNFPVGLVAHVTNGVDHDGKQFEKGPVDFDITLLQAICTGVHQWLTTL